MADEYLSSSLLAVDSTLIRFYSDAPGEVIVPSREGKLRLTAVGQGAVVADQAESLVIGEGYTELAERCLHGKSLKQLTLPASLRAGPRTLKVATDTIPQIVLRRSLLPEERRRLDEVSIPIGGFARLLPTEQLNLPGLAPLEALAWSVTEHAFRHCCPAMRYIFCYEQEALTIFTTCRCLDLAGQVTETEEYAAVMEMIREGVTGYRHSQSEWQSDLRVRLGLVPARLRYLLYFVTYTDPSALKIERARLFSPALYPVRMDGHEWFLYSRLHFSGDLLDPYEREDICVFDRDGLVTDRTLSEAVYGKARLMMCL